MGNKALQRKGWIYKSLYVCPLGVHLGRNYPKLAINFRTAVVFLKLLLPEN